MKKLHQISLLLFLSLIISNYASSQGIKEIQASQDILWGIGISQDYKQADLLAMDDLISKISVHVYSKTEVNSIERNDSLSKYYNSVIKTYSSIRLTQAKQIMEENNGKYTILRYIPKSRIKEIFNQRLKKVKAYTALACKAEKENRIGDAITYYYWSYALLLSHPEKDKIETEIPGTGKILMNAYLYDCINRLFTNLDIEVSKIVRNGNNKKTIYLNITYNGKKTENFDYRYYTGTGFSPIISSTHGIGEIELFNEASRSLSNVNLMIEYECINKCFDSEMKEVLKTINVPFFKKSKFKINVCHKNTITTDEVKNAQKNIVYKSVNIKKEDIQVYKNALDKIIFNDKTKDITSLKKYFADDGFSMYKKLLNYGKAKFLPFVDTLKFIKVGNDVMLRSIPMSFYYPNNDRIFIEDVVFTFDKDKKISAVSFALSDKAISDILGHSQSFGSKENKYQIIKFMELYKTAYSLKRIDYIDDIFANNALIIVGTMLKKAESIDKMYLKVGENNVKYIKLTKTQYMRRLLSAFRSNEFINIKFEDNIVRKLNGNDKIYGVQIAQHYYSSNYSDFGYLFLMFDLNDSLNPKIYVRTWQPKKNPDGSIYGLNDFSMY